MTDENEKMEEKEEEDNLHNMREMDALMVGMNVTKSATQMTLPLIELMKEQEKDVEILKEKAKALMDDFYEHIKEKTLEIFNMVMESKKKKIEETDNPFLMVFIDKKGDKKPEDYKDIFEKYGFKLNQKGGYYARMRKKEWEEILNKYDWLPKAVEIKTEIAKKQEDD